MTVLVTGATGNIGRQVVTQLFTNGDRQVRALVRDPATARLPPEVELVRGDLGEPDTLTDALDGVDGVFLIWPHRSAAALPAVLDLIRARVVFLASGAVLDLDPDGQRELLARTSTDWTFLRPATFAVNTRWWARQIRTGDVVRGSHGELAMPLIHERDIAAVAVRALTEPGHCGASYALTGPELLGQAEQVRLIGEAIGRPLHWQELPRQDAAEQLIADGVPAGFVDVLLDTYAVMAGQPPLAVTNTVERVTGAPATTFRQWAIQHADDFR